MTGASGPGRRCGARRALGIAAAAVLATGPVLLPVVRPAGGPVAGAAASAAPVLTDAASGVHVELEQLGPTALVPGSQLQVLVRITNTTGSPVVGARARLFVDSPVLADRAAVAAWAAGEGVQGGDRFAGVDGAEQVLDDVLAPGGSTDVQFSVAADELDLDDAFGPRGVTVDVLDASLQRLDALRTFVVWMPQPSPPATAGLTVLAPVVAGAPDVTTGQLPEASLEALVRPDGRLARVLTATAASPATSLVIDPAVLGPFAQPTGSATTAPASGQPATAGASPQDPAPTTTAQSSTTTAPGGGASSPGGGQQDLVAGTDASSSPEAASWLAQLDGRTPGGITALPQGDVDALSAASAGASQLLPLALAQSSATALERTGSQPVAQLVWPVDAAPAAPVVLAGAAAGPPAAASGDAGSAVGAPTRLVVLDAAAVAGATGPLGTAPATVTTTALAPDGSTASARAVLVDAADSALLAAATSAGGAGADPATGAAADPEEVAARLLADTAVTASAPAPADDLVLALPRGWDPDPSAATAVLTPLGTAPWVRSAPLPDLLAEQPAAVLPVDDRSVLTTATAPAAPLPADGLLEAQGAVDAAAAAASVVSDSERRALLEPVERSAVAAASLGWRSRPESEWRTGLAGLVARGQQLEGAVSVVSGGDVLAIASGFNLPVTVRNSLSQTATVLVQIRSSSYRLVAEEPYRLEIPPGAQAQAPVPVRAVASGDTTVTVVLTDASGAQVGEPTQLRVRVRADWEGRGVAVAAAVALLVFVGGVVRTVVRVRRRPVTPVVRSAEEADGDGPPRTPDRRPEEPTP